MLSIVIAQMFCLLHNVIVVMTWKMDARSYNTSFKLVIPKAAECDGTKNFFRYRDRYIFPGPIFSGTGTFFRDQFFSVPVPVPSKKEQHSRDRDVTLWQRGKKKICFSLKSCISHGWLLFHSLFHFGNSFLLIPFYSFTFSPFSRCQILPLCSTFPPFSFSPFLKI